MRNIDRAPQGGRAVSLRQPADRCGSGIDSGTFICRDVGSCFCLFGQSDWAVNQIVRLQIFHAPVPSDETTSTFQAADPGPHADLR